MRNVRSAPELETDIPRLTQVAAGGIYHSQKVWLIGSISSQGASTDRETQCRWVFNKMEQQLV